MTSDGIWILIPAYNEGKTIRRVIEGVRVHSHNIVIVNDGSVDDTGEQARMMGCKVLNHDRNLGKGAALKSGFRWLLERDCEAVLTMDADGQHDPSEIPQFLEFYRDLKSDCIIIGARSIERENMPLYRAIPNRVGELFISLAARKHIHDTQSGFRLYSRGVIESIRCRSDGFDMEAEILIKAARLGFELSDLHIRTIYQENYTSHFRPVSDFYKISKVVLKNLF